MKSRPDEMPLFASRTAPAADGAAPAVTVSALTKRIKHALDADAGLKDLRVVGELSNFKRHSSGHIYFTLKDGTSQINCVFFKFRNRDLAFNPADGMEVVASGYVEVYEPHGSYQLYVKRLDRSGIGELYQQLEEVKKKLVAEGLTAAARKRPLPAFPRRIGIVSSADSAGLRDVMKVLTRRFPLATVVIAPVNVEGIGAAPSIVAGLRLMAARGRADVVIVGRGGGSIESLWGFNTETVARAIAAMPVPVVSAVGHETDTTLADLVADRRAATPTEAGELVAPDVSELAAGIEAAKARAERAVKRRWKTLADRVALFGRTLRSPETALELRWERFDRAWERLSAACAARLAAGRERLGEQERRLARRSPERVLLATAHTLERSRDRLLQALARRDERVGERLKLSLARLTALSPLAILGRGYAVALADGRPVRAAGEVERGDRLTLRLHRGVLDCEVKDKKEEDRGQEG